MHLNLQQAAALIPEAICLAQEQIEFSQISHDSRKLVSGDLFIALKGERFDGHDFLQHAKQQGACAALIQDATKAHILPSVLVRDSIKAYGYLAQAHRKRISCKVIAVAGSNGKTTTTQMIASILRYWLGTEQSWSTQHNYNNAIGVPQTLLGLNSAHKAAVIEIGSNHLGEIAWLAQLVVPDVVLLINAQREHQEFFQSLQAVAEENGSSLHFLSEAGVAVLPIQDPFFSDWKKLVSGKTVISYAVQSPGDKICADVTLTLQESQSPLSQSLCLRLHDAVLFECNLWMLGRHHVHNAAAACAVALAVGAPYAAIKQALEAFRPQSGRMQVHEVAGKVLIDDTYNANPDSVRAAIEALAKLQSPKLFIFGDMGEVGEQARNYHEEMGAYAKANNIDVLWSVGEQAQHSQRTFGDSMDARISDNAARLDVTGVEHYQSILVKGSRFMRMEQIVQAIQQQLLNDNTKKEYPCYCG